MGLQVREAAAIEREQENERRAAQLAEREQTSAARNAALEESLTIAREQLSTANRRAESLENGLQEQLAETVRWRSRAEGLEAAGLNLSQKLDADATAHRAERTSLQERQAAAEARWMTEVDRARQLTKEATKELERQIKGPARAGQSTAK
jgi:hypothetical protein